MKKISLKTSSIELLKKLNATQIQILITMAGKAKNNYLDMTEGKIKEVAGVLDIEPKTVRNNLRKLVEAEVMVKAGSLSTYVIDPAVIVTDNEQKALKHFEAARTNQDQLRKNVATEKKNSRGDFQTKKLEAELKNRKASLDDVDILEESKKSFTLN